jgi:hypothetical protein
MLSRKHFYHRITRKLVVAFGTLFNNIQLYRYNKAGTVEIERIVVPLSYASKEKFYARITQDPNLNKEIQVTLPRMSFEMTSISYDPLRKTSLFNNLYSPSNNISGVKQTPYNFTFSLSIYVRNTEDGTQIIEQILPYFSPDYTLKVNLTGLDGLNVDVPIILDSVAYNDNYTGVADDLRVLTWDLTFTVKGYLYGAIDDNINIIRQSTANLFNELSTTNNDKILTLTSGIGINYKVGELVYEGRSPLAANGSAFVSAWSNVSNEMVVTQVNGIFKSGYRLFGAVSNAAYTISTTGDSSLKVVNIDVTPTPNTANVNSAYGFDVDIDEYPNIV